MQDLTAELAGPRALVEELRAGNAQLLRLLKLSPTEARVPGPAQSGWFESAPGPVHARSSAPEKVAFFGALFEAGTDVYALRWENRRTGDAGRLPVVRGGVAAWYPARGTGIPAADGGSHHGPPIRGVRLATPTQPSGIQASIR
jgi:hypothetical protein